MTPESSIPDAEFAVRIRGELQDLVELRLPRTLVTGEEYDTIAVWVHVKAGSFATTFIDSIYPATILTFHRDLQALYAFEVDTASFSSDALEFTLSLNHRGAIALTGRASPLAEDNALAFSFLLDQSFLIQTIAEFKAVLATNAYKGR